MLFNSKIFIMVFLPIVLLGYFGLNRIKKETWGMLWLILASLIFYGYYRPIYLPIILISVITNYSFSCNLYKEKRKMQRKVLLGVGLFLNISVLFVFKYYNFFVENLNLLFHSNFIKLKLVMPLGISFFTFQQISYLIDCYRKEMSKYSFTNYAAYVLFFPQLIAGPIVLHNELIPQFQNVKKKRLSFEWLAKGLYAFALGLGKKVLLADTLGLIANVGFIPGADLSSADVVIVALSYTMQIYLDFSGYCDMARGIGYMFHIELPNNFNSPYKAVSISDFWKRWHITLTRFLTKYIYIPLGGNRKGNIRELVNIMIVFTISGLWHGANWTFVFWGVLHGLVMVLERTLGKYLVRTPRLIRRIGTMIFLIFSWIYFRADSISQANRMILKIFEFDYSRISKQIIGIVLGIEEIIPFQFLLGANSNSGAIVILILFLFMIMIWCMLTKNTQEKMEEFQPSIFKSIVTIVLISYGILSLNGASIFLYFNF